MSKDFQRVAIVNRGEAAMRFVHAARELTGEGAPITSIALYTDPDRYAPFVRHADEGHCLGPASFVDPRDGERKPTYLDYARLAQALQACRAEAVWVGWGFVAEHAAFTDLCAELGIVFIGPSGDVMRRLGDKIASKILAETAGVPVVPWSGGAVDDLDQARHHAAAIGYPLMIKATAGGGGRGIRRVGNDAELAEAFERARSEAQKAFGDGTLFMERQVQMARHIEVQVVADHHGHAWALGVRDCSVQRRNQKIIEEGPCPVLSAEQDREVKDAAVRLVHAAGYHNAGTVEFLLDADHKYWFMEVNARLQVEHPVTELTTGADLVKLQVHVARGGALEGDPPPSRGHAIEVRLNAEDPDNDFAPAPGIVDSFRIPCGPGLRVDTGVGEGDVIPREFDSMIAKVLAWGRDRDEALARLRRALSQSRVVVRDGTTNKPFLLELLSRDEVRRCTADVGWLDRQMAAGGFTGRAHATIALLRAAIEAYEAELGVECTQFFASATRGRPETTTDVGRLVELGHQGQVYRLRVRRLGHDHRYRVEVDGVSIDVVASRVSGSPLRERRGGGSEWDLTCAGRTYRVILATQALGYLVEVDGAAHRISRDSAGAVRSTAPALVVALAVSAGDEVRAGDRLLVLEAMKMELALRAPFDGRVKEILVAPGVQVPSGALLLSIEPLETGAAAPVGERVAFGALALAALPPASPQYQRRLMDDLLALVLGYDVDAAAVSRAVLEWQAASTVELSPESLAAEDRVLEAFIDTCALFDRRPDDDGRARPAPVSQETHLFAYLRTLDAGDDRLPTSFVTALTRALAQHATAPTEGGPELREALFRLFKANRREDAAVRVVTALLDRRLQQAGALSLYPGEDTRVLMDRLVAVSEHRHQAVNDLAREVRYRLFDQPLLERARREVYDAAERELAQLSARPFGPDRADRMRALIECPQPLATLLLRRLPAASDDVRQLLLEVMARRFYRIRDLRDLRTITFQGHAFTMLDYDLEGRSIHVVLTYAARDRVREVLEIARPLLEVPGDTDAALDLYVWQDGALPDAEPSAAEFRALLSGAGFASPLRRVVIGLASMQGGYGTDAMQHFTYRSAPETGYVEERFYRGVHPMMGKRLQLSRLAHFDIERLPSVEDVYVMLGRAHGNPRDERIFVVAEVRDLTPIRDDTGRILQLPHLERMFMEALAGLRRAQARRPADRRLLWNRVLLYVWPPFTLEPDDLVTLVTRLSPPMADLGLEAVVIRCRVPDPSTGVLVDRALVLEDEGHGVSATLRDVMVDPIEPLTSYEQKVVRARQMGMLHPHELVRMLTAPREPSATGTRDLPTGEFFEYDLNGHDQLLPVSRPPGENTANVVVGVIRNFTVKYPDGMTRVILLGDPSRDLGALAEPECRRIIAAIDLAEQKRVPIEWFALSAGAKISMDSGVENMDWIALVLRRLVTFTQNGGEVNIIVNGINVGAQPYWNAESTMLMHTRGILIMLPESAMVLTGKRALDYSGGVSAEDNQGIGGYDRIMGPNGQAQYFARDMRDALRILLAHYEHTHIAPGEIFPRRSGTTDPVDRDVCAYPYGLDHGFRLLGDVFSDQTNPGRKKPFDVRRVMAAVIDQDHTPLERWAGWRDAEITVAWDAHLGGWPVQLIGVESRPLQRLGFVPADGPETWTAGTLFPQSSRKMARAINAASGNRPVVILANLSGFDGSPESLRNWQLEYGAEIGRAIVNFRGPIVFCVISRYHGGAFVVFSNALNPNLEVAALEGAYASVIGGAPAAAVVFAREVDKRTAEDPRLREVQAAIQQASGAERGRLRGRLADLQREVKAAKINEMAEEFDHVHSVHRAQRVGAVHYIVKPGELRRYLVAAVERGIRRELHMKGRERLAPQASVDVRA